MGRWPQILLSLFCLVSTASAAVASATLPTASFGRSDGAEGTVLRIEGVITPELADRFAETLAEMPAGQPLIVELNSPGGYTTAGYAMIDRMLAEREAGRPIATRVRTGEVCESMCFGLFMAGFPRQAGPGAEFMVHAPRSLETGLMTVRATGAMIDRIRRLGASDAWIEQVRATGAFSGRLDYRETAASLAGNGSNTVTDLLP